MTQRLFTKLLGVFLLLLAVQMLVVEFLIHRIGERAAGEVLGVLGRDALWSVFAA